MSPTLVHFTFVILTLRLLLYKIYFGALSIFILFIGSGIIRVNLKVSLLKVGILMSIIILFS